MKMKRLFNFLTLAFVMVAMLDACSTEEAIGGGAQKHQLSISVKDGLFTSSTETRTSPTGANGLGTMFTINDKIGIFGVKNGQVMENVANVCYTNDGHLWNGTQAIEYDPAATYYAYYPWISDEELKTTADVADVSSVVNPAASTADDFFKPLINKWEPKQDQSLMENYNASDLMVGKGTAPEQADQYTMEFTMNHQMALCLTTLQEITFVVDANYRFNLMPNYKFVGDVKPCYYQNKFRYIVKPEEARVLKVSNGDETYIVNYFVKQKGNYTEHVVGGCEKEYQPRVGDVFYSDGSMTHGDEISIYKKQVGIVGYVSNVDNDPMLEGFTHGLVMCGHTKQIAGNSPFTTEAMEVLSPNSTTITCYGDALKNYNGYKLSKLFLDKDIVLLTNGTSGAGTYALWLAEVNKDNPLENDASKAPNSGWFAPGSAQAYKIINGIYMANGGSDLNLENHSKEQYDSNYISAPNLQSYIDNTLKNLGVGHFDVTNSNFMTLTPTANLVSSTKSYRNVFNFMLNDTKGLVGSRTINAMRPILAF